MLTTILRSSTTRGSHFRKTSKYSYSVWRSVKNDDTLLRTSTNNLASSQNGVHDILINFNCSPYIKNCSVNRRLVSTSSVRLKEASSKVEQTVERLKDKVEEKESLDNLEKKIDSKIVATTTDATTTTTITTSKKSLWVRIKDEGKHFWSGCKLLVLDVRVCSRIIWKITRGKTITRRERRQLTRTAAVSLLKRIVDLTEKKYFRKFSFFAGSLPVSSILGICSRPVYGVITSGCIETFSWDVAVHIYYTCSTSRKNEKEQIKSQIGVHKIASRNIR